MKNELALRYLLLRHLERVREHVDDARFEEITHSLRVEVEGRTRYRVFYRDGGEEREESFPFDTFSFYGRADTRPETRSVDDELRTPNDERAAAFARRVTGLPEPSPERAPLPALEARWGMGSAEMLALPLAIGAVAGLSPVAFGALVLLCLAELAPRGRLLSSILFVGVALTGPALASAGGALAYGALQLLDPDPRARGLRALSCGVAFVVALFAAPQEPVLRLDGWTLSTAGAGLLLSGWRSLHGSWFRALPLAMPCYCGGLALGGLPEAACAGLAVTAVATAIERLRPPIAPPGPPMSGGRDSS